MHLVGIRDYSISHFFDASQRVAVVTRLDSGVDILIYVERAWVDDWSGFASLCKKTGRKVLGSRGGICWKTTVSAGAETAALQANRGFRLESVCVADSQTSSMQAESAGRMPLPHVPA